MRKSRKITQEQILKSSRTKFMKKGFRQIDVSKDEIINGLMLSDGNLQKPLTQFQNSRFVLGQSTKNIQLVYFFQKHLKTLGIESSIRYYKAKLGDTVILNSLKYPDFTRLRELWYYDGTKIVPRNLVLTEKTLAFWFMGDGSTRWMNRKKARRVNIHIATYGFDNDSVIFLRNKLNELGLEKIKIYYRLMNPNRQPHIYIDNDEDVIKFMNIVKPYIIDCFAYKIKYPEVNH